MAIETHAQQDHVKGWQLGQRRLHLQQVCPLVWVGRCQAQEVGRGRLVTQQQLPDHPFVRIFMILCYPAVVRQ